jgi:hypothetical protein
MHAICHKFRPAGVVNHSVYWRDSRGSNQEQQANANQGIVKP